MSHFERTPLLDHDDADDADATPLLRVGSFIRSSPHGADAAGARESEVPRERERDSSSPPSAVPSAVLMAAATQDPDGFLDVWVARHFSISVKLFDIQRGLGPMAVDAELVLADLELVQDVLFELREFATKDSRVRDAMRVTSVVQNGVAAVYAWLDDTLDAIGRSGAAFSRSPSFVDAGDGGPPVAMLRAFERLHPDLEALVVGEGGIEAATSFETDMGHKLAICFRQIGAAVVRISGRGATTLPGLADPTVGLRKL